MLGNGYGVVSWCELLGKHQLHELALLGSLESSATRTPALLLFNGSTATQLELFEDVHLNIGAASTTWLFGQS